MVLKARIIFSVLLLFTAFQGFAQVSFESEAELEKAANTFFDASDYAKAKPLFSQLLSKDALNPDYNYRFGVCILFTEADPMKPLPYIEGGASTKGVNVEAHYFLGKAFQLNYRFDDAIKSYEKGKSLGFSRPDIDLDRNIQECRNGKILYNPAIDFQPAMDKDVIASEFYRPYDFRKLKGKVIPMPSEFKTKYDEKNLTGTVIYTPTNSQTLIYASYGEDGANAKDLYRVNRLPNGELALPLRLPNTINTKYDEDYAFYDEESQMLFFASKGHNSMGGYDVFSSKYDANNSTWSTPLNLQYPINSPFDDFLYVSDPEGKVAFFTTDRNVEAGKLRVMKTLLHDPQQVEVSVLEGTFVDKTDSIYNYAALTVLDPITNEVVGKYRSHKVTGKYLLILPPQNDYTMDVGPREANGFKFDLDVPKHEAVSPLQQKIVYDASSASGTITLTNYFDATGNPDTVKFIENRSLKDVEERMVAMPDPSEILAANSQVDAKKKEAEQKALTAVAAEKAKQDAVKKAEESALKEKQTAEEFAKQAELAKAEQARLDAIREAEKQALAEKDAASEKAELEADKQAEELALKEKQTAEEFAKQAELAKAEQARLDAIREAEKQAFELAEKEAATKATQDELAKATQAEELALKEKQTAEEFAKQAELAKAEQARLDAIREAEKQAFELAEKEAATKATQDELAKATQAEELALKEKQTAEEFAKQAELSKAEQARLDAIREAEKQAFELAEKEAAAKATQDELAKATQAEELALKEKQTAEEFAKQAELAKAEQARLDAIREAEKQAFELAEKEAAAKATQDELAKATQAEELALKEKQTAEEFAKQAELAKAEQARLDAIREAEKQAFELAEKEAAAKAKQAKELDFIAQAREDFTKDSIRQVEEFEKLHASHMEARAKRDSVNKALELAKLNEAGEQAKRDSIVELELKTEQDKLAQIQLLKSQQDFLTQTKAAEIKSQLATLEAEEEKSNSQTKTELPVSEVVEAKPEKSTASIQKEEVNQTVAVEVFKPAQDEFAEVKNTKVESKDDVNPLFQPTSEVKLTVDSPATEPVIELAETEVLSESELFLQTIAKLEAQKRDQEQLVVTENAEKKKAQEEKKLAQAEAKRAADTSSVKMQGDGSVEGAIAAETEPVVSDTSDVETMSMALKSDANPQEYLIALAEIEKKIAKEAAANINKSYELKELPSKPGVSPNADPVLQSIMESDREALTAHQKIAVEKEKALKEQMKRDKGIVELAEQVAEKELEIIENEIVQKLDVRPTLAKEELVLESKKAVVPESKSEIVIEPVKVVEPVRNIEVAEQKQTVTEVPKKNEVDQEVLDALAEFDRILAGSEKPEIATGNVESKSSEEKAEVSEVEINEPEVSISSEPVLAEEVVVEKTQLKEKEEKVEVNVGDEVSALSEKEIIEEVVEIQQEEVKQGLDKPKQASTGSVGTIPFLTAAKRSYSTAKPSFEKIEDVSMRRMVQRMRAEDVGRMAVLKNMKNEWVDAGKSDEALKEIKGNTRNQDVLESVAAATSREEYIRPPFDTNTLRKRKDVYYKLDFRITTAGVSQTVSESMTPEQAMSFAMPEFDLKDGFYHTLADVTSDLKEYQRRGFDSLRIIPFLKNEQVTLSDVTDVPFVD